MWVQVLAIALKTSLLMGAAGAVAALLAGRSAALRHLVWVSALALALLMPVATALAPAYAVVPAPWRQARPAAADPRVTAQTPPVRAARDVGQSMAETAGPAVLVVWLGGALLILLREAAGHAGLARWGRRARALRSPSWTAALQCLGAGRTSSLRVLESDEVTSPCTWGVLRPVLVLPAAAEAWSDAQRRDALTHELAHIARGDYLSAAIARLACAMHWYNPLVWRAAQEARELQERACDDAVLRAGAVASDYAQLLVELAARGPGVHGPLRPAMGMSGRSPLRDRVTAILDPGKARAEQGRLAAVAALAPLACVTGLLACLTFAEPGKAQTPGPARRPPPALIAAATPSQPERVSRGPARRHRAPMRTIAPLTLADRDADVGRTLRDLAPVPAIPATPAIPALPALPAAPAVPATPAVPPAPPTLPVLPTIPP
jgi:beta-lactamase regulating signal transducer with metallopeptidase domain